MLLGDILAAARGSASRFQDWLETCEPELAREVAKAAAEAGLEPAEYVRMAVGDFDRLAPEEDWQSLTSHLRNSEDPGMVCLRAMVDWRIQATGRTARHRPANHENDTREAGHDQPAD